MGALKRGEGVIAIPLQTIRKNLSRRYSVSFIVRIGLTLLSDTLPKVIA